MKQSKILMNDKKNKSTTTQSQQSQKDMLKQQSVSPQILKDVLNKNLSVIQTQKLFDTINKNKQDNNEPTMTLSQYSSIIKQIKTIILKMKVQYPNMDLIEWILKNMNSLMDFISKNYKVNTQRKIITDMITLLTYSNNTIPARFIKSLELHRKKIQLQEKKDKQKQIQDKKAIDKVVKKM